MVDYYTWICYNGKSDQKCIKSSNPTLMDQYTEYDSLAKKSKKILCEEKTDGKSIKFNNPTYETNILHKSLYPNILWKFYMNPKVIKNALSRISLSL